MSLWETIDELLDDPANTSNGNQSQAQNVHKAYNEDELDENELLGINEEEDDLFGDLSGSENVVSESRSDEKSYPVSIQASSSDLAVGSEDDVRENFRRPPSTNKSSPVNNKSNGNKESEYFFSATSVDKTDDDGLDIGQAETDDLIENNKTDKRARGSETEKSASETDVSTKRTDDDDDEENDEKRTSRSSHWSERNVDKPSQPVDNSNAQNYNNRRNFNNTNRNGFNNRQMGGMNNMNKRPHMNGQDGLLPIPQLMQQPIPRPNNSLMYQQKTPQQQQQQPTPSSMGGPFFNATGNQLIRPMLDSNNMNMMQQFKTNLGMNQFVPNQFGLQQPATQQHSIQQQPQIQAAMQLQQPRAQPMMQYPSMNQNSFPPQQQRYPGMMNTPQPMNNSPSGMFQNQNDLTGNGLMHNSQVVMPLMPHQSQFMMNQFQKPNMGQNVQQYPMMPSQQNVMPVPQQQAQPALLNSLMATPQVVMPQSMAPQQSFNAVPPAQQMKPNHVFINPSFIAKQNMPSSAPPVSNNEEKKPARSRKDLDMLLEKRLAEELSKSREDERNKKKANSPPPLKRKSSEMSSDKQSGSSKNSKMPRQNENKRQVESVSSSSSSNGKRESDKKEEKSVDKPSVVPAAVEQPSMIVIDDPDYYKKLEEQKRKREEVLRMKNEKRNQRILELKKTENLNGHVTAAENTQKSTSTSSSSGFGSRTVIQISSDEPTGRLASLCSAVDVKHKSTR